MSKLGLKYLPNKSNYTPNVPREFQSTYRASSLSKNPDFEDHKSGTSTPIVSVPSVQINPKAAIKATAMKQRKEIFDWLSIDNPPPSEILLRLTKCATPYAKLLSLACEELGYTHAPTRSTKIDDLEREAALSSAKKEVEIQQQQEKLAKSKAEKSDMSEKIKRHKNRLDKINNDISMLQSLSIYNGIDPDEKITEKKEVVLVESTLEKKIIPLDENEYKKLWNERQELLEHIEELQKQLREVQEMQMESMREKAKQKVSKTTTRQPPTASRSIL